MIIYGVALLAICTLAGVILGDLLGVLLGVKSNVGGVGIAMILLICARLWMQKHGGMTKDCEMGVGFWGAMYIPVVVAMAAQQNVVTALKGGPVAVLAAIGSVVLCAVTITLISRTNRGAPLPKEEPVVIPNATPAGGR
ncbi:malonate transporter subunit MadL [Pseudomonas sp. NPDC089734]|uniref:malonate transporter subunit MadL n=1 Tax=Pseudomonas sp. NPDC089734 TaxID=3364469 RepID=UPI003800A9BD